MGYIDAPDKGRKPKRSKCLSLVLVYILPVQCRVKLVLQVFSPALISVGTYSLRGPDASLSIGPLHIRTWVREGIPKLHCFNALPSLRRASTHFLAQREFYFRVRCLLRFGSIKYPPPPGIRGNSMKYWPLYFELAFLPCSSAMVQVARFPSVLGQRAKHNSTPRRQYLPSIPSPALRKFPRFTKGGGDEGFHLY